MLILASCPFAVAFTWSQTVSLALFSNRVQHAVRVETYHAMQGLDMAFFHDRQTGQVMSILNNDVRNLRSFLDSTVGGAIQLVVTVLGSRACSSGSTPASRPLRSFEGNDTDVSMPMCSSFSQHIPYRK